MGLTNEDLLAISQLLDTKLDAKLKEELQPIREDMQTIKSDMQDMKHSITALELHLENGTDKAIKLIAENFTDLTDKLNQAIPVANKNLAYEIKVNYLIEEVDKLKKELTELKNKIA